MEVSLPGGNYGALIAVTPSRRIIAAGLSPGSSHSITLVRFDQRGALDPTFGVEGVAVIELSDALEHMLYHCVALPDERVVLIGTRKVSNMIAQDYFFSCVGADGALDGSFGSGGTTIIAPYNRVFHVFSATLQSDGKVLAHGEGVQWPEGYTANALMRLDHDGRPDPTFGEDGVHFVERGLRLPALVVRPDGRILMGGWSDSHAQVRGYDAAGQTDVSFGDGGVADLPVPGGESMTTESLALQADGRVIVQGQISPSDNDKRRSFVMKLRPHGERDHTFNRGEPLALSWTPGRAVLADAAGRVFALARDEYVDRAQLTVLTPDGFVEQPVFTLPFPGVEYHFPANQLLEHLPGTLLVNAQVIDPDTQVHRLMIARLLI
ncbi:hypothetical protein PSEMO_43770 [Pseudomonas putida]|uniref:Delta-60 repeat domain-containing protein n=1 Tax=Pseudomonas putida TaxID=303 RepID=A0A1Q9QZW7_PSEPU|nr:hypothetical protein PSEMO_43770 [Pseudomonas putida]